MIRDISGFCRDTANGKNMGKDAAEYIEYNECPMFSNCSDGMYYGFRCLGNILSFITILMVRGAALCEGHSIGCHSISRYLPQYQPNGAGWEDNFDSDQICIIYISTIVCGCASDRTHGFVEGFQGERRGMAGRGRERGVRLPKSGVRVDFFSSNQGSLKNILEDGEDDGGTTVGSFVQVIVLEIYDLLSSNGGGGFGFGWPKSNVSNSKSRFLGRWSGVSAFTGWGCDIGERGEGVGCREKVTADDAYYVEASTNQLVDQQMPVYNLASKILCQAEPDNDEVFAQVTLLPESNSTSFVADQKLPYLDFAETCWKKIDVEACEKLNTGISTQILQTLFKVKGVVHYGIAGNADPQLEIGDVTIPQFWAHTGLWNWQLIEYPVNGKIKK
ncbi:hypothetical protein DVH24_023748 [Malus domestica]|uniref:Nucleoside phosphorylase domain-containing protein n=1 Tax=Malus domestica TaxID=3750 RepID=A0A498I5M0_MALDO|nr:hypothetical protein DVH24_023748 [Malus domestica]